LEIGLPVITTTGMKMAVFWDVASCSLVEVYRGFRGGCCHHHQGDKKFLAPGLHITLMMEAASTFQTAVKSYQTNGATLQKTAMLTEYPYLENKFRFSLLLWI
jgi:hypothetical protein